MLAIQALSLRKSLQAVFGFTLLASLCAFGQNLNYPQGVFVDAHSNIYVANNVGNNVTVYNSAMVKTATITAGVGAPTSVAVNREGQVFIANADTSSITAYDSSFQQIPAETMIDSGGFPTQITIGAYDELYEVNSAGTLNVYDAGPVYGGIRIASVSLSGTLNSVVVAPPNVICVGANLNGASGTDIFVYLLATNVLSHNPAPYLVYFDSLYTPFGAAFDPTTGYIWTTDVTHGIVSIQPPGATNPNLNVLLVASTPWGIAIDPVKKRIFISEPLKNQVEVFSLIAPFKRIKVLK